MYHAYVSVFGQTAEQAMYLPPAYAEAPGRAGRGHKTVDHLVQNEQPVAVTLAQSHHLPALRWNELQSVAPARRWRAEGSETFLLE